MCKRGPTQPYLGHEVRTTKETKESFDNLETTWVATFFLLFLGLRGISSIIFYFLLFFS
jgi:hypothetical protein